MIQKIIFSLALCAAMTLAPQADAGQLNIIYENDALGFDDKDRYYTNGMEIGYLTDHYLDVAIGHQIFIPANSGAYPLILDRPDVSHTYVSVGYHVYQEIKGFGQISTGEITVGFMGLDGVSYEMQKRANQIFGDSRQFHYSQQIENEPTFMFSLGYGLSLNKDLISENPRTWNWDFQPRTTASFGTPYTRLGIGMEVRLGRNLPLSSYMPVIRPANGAKMYRTKAEKDDLSFYLFYGFDTYAVFWNSFLDGNISSKNSPRIETNNFVIDMSAGLVLSYKDLTLTFAQLMRTKEYETQEAPHVHGTVSLSYFF